MKFIKIKEAAVNYNRYNNDKLCQKRHGIVTQNKP